MRNVDDLFNDLDFIITKVTEEKAKLYEWRLKRIKNSIKEL